MFTIHKTLGATILVDDALFRLALSPGQAAAALSGRHARMGSRALAVWSHRIVYDRADRAAADRLIAVSAKAKDGWVDLLW